MKIYTLKRKQILPKPLKELFAFFARPENLQQITPPELGFQIITPSPIVMEKGSLIDYQIRLSGFPFRWRTLITNYNPPHEFVDEQIKGPYSYWHHRHQFYTEGDTTVIEDTVTYTIPFGILGRILHTLFIRKKLRKIFEYRKDIIEKLFEERQDKK
ncbi:MAG TPA: CDP-paratose 2-epimerase [Candidatus Marinimicrobia bacterium]|nr:CDP-paratose 2-epimerase [Candidatus Neomarinimicrobiota bacterium]